MSQSLLDKTYKEYKKKVKDNKKELVTIITQLLQNKRILAQAKEHTHKKALYLINKLAKDSKEINIVFLDYIIIDTLVRFSPTIQLIIDLINSIAALPISNFQYIFIYGISRSFTNSYVDS